FILAHADHRYLHSFPTRRSSDLLATRTRQNGILIAGNAIGALVAFYIMFKRPAGTTFYEIAVLFLAFTAILLTSLSRTKPFIIRSEEHTSELQSRGHLVCRLLLE